MRGLLWMQSNGTVVIGAGLAITGIIMLGVLGPVMLTQPWLLVALSIYAANLELAFFIQRSSLRRLIGINAAADDAVWKARARRQRYLSYAMAGLVGTIGFLMSAKPPRRLDLPGVRSRQRSVYPSLSFTSAPPTV